MKDGGLKERKRIMIHGRERKRRTESREKIKAGPRFGGEVGGEVYGLT